MKESAERVRPWFSEPDRDEWTDEATGLACFAKRGAGSAWCGYVRLPDPTTLDLDADEWQSLDVHGGVTWGPVAFRRDVDPRLPDGVWVGFDCCHHGDLMPLGSLFANGSETYRTLDYVRGECSRLAAQVIATQQKASNTDAPGDPS